MQLDKLLSHHYYYSIYPVMIEYEPSGPGVCLGDGQTETYLKDTGLASAWLMVRQRPREDRKVDAASRCSGVCPHT